MLKLLIIGIQQLKEDWEEIEITDPNLDKGDRVLAFVNGMGGGERKKVWQLNNREALSNE